MKNLKSGLFGEPQRLDLRLTSDERAREEKANQKASGSCKITENIRYLPFSRLPLTGEDKKASAQFANYGTS